MSTSRISSAETRLTLTQLRLRPARVADEAGVARLAARLAAEGAGAAPAPSAEELAADRRRRRAFLWVAAERRNGEIVAFLRVGREPLPRLSHLGVAAAWRPSGVGIALLQVGLDLLGRRGRSELAMAFEIDGPLGRVLDAWHGQRARLWLWLALGFAPGEAPAGPTLAALPATGLSLADFLKALELDPAQQLDLELWQARRHARQARRREEE